MITADVFDTTITCEWVIIILLVFPVVFITQGASVTIRDLYWQ